MERTEPEDISASLTLRTLSSTGAAGAKTIHPIEGDIPSGLRSLGRAAGSDTNVAVAMLYQHCPGFFDRVVAYRLVEDAELSESVGMSGRAIEFFEGSAR